MRRVGHALAIVSICLIALSIGTHELSYTILIDRQAVAYVGGNNPSALVGITIDGPVYVNEGQILRGCKLLSIKNNLVEPMYLISIWPTSSRRAGYNINLSYFPGPYSFESENGVHADIQGLKEGVYVETYEITVCWGNNIQSAFAVTRLYNIEVIIVVANQTGELTPD